MNKLYSGVTETEGRSRGVKRTDSDLGDKYVHPERGSGAYWKCFIFPFTGLYNAADGFHVSCFTFHAVAEGQPGERLHLKNSPLIKESKEPFSKMRLCSSGMGYLSGKRDI